MLVIAENQLFQPFIVINANAFMIDLRKLLKPSNCLPVQSAVREKYDLVSVVQCAHN